MRRLLLATTAGGWLFCAYPVLAQTMDTTTTDASAASDASKTRSTRLEEVTVTANKRRQNLQKTAASVTAISGTTLQEEGKTQIGDILQDVVGVTLSGSSSSPSQVYVRGIGPQDPNTTSQVSYVVDGVSSSAGSGFGVGSSSSAGTVNFDLDQVEVARGPQGTSYGGNSGAGAIIINTKNPELGQYAAGGTIETGSYALLHTEGYVNVPLTDTVAIRGSFYTDRHDGYFSNGLGDDDTAAGRVKALYKPDAALSIVLSGQITHIGGRPNASAIQNATTGALSSNPWTSNDSTNEVNVTRTYELKGKIVYTTPDAVITALPYYVHNHSYSVSSQNGNEGQSLTISESKSLELRAESPSENAWYWQAGLYASMGNTPQSENDSSNLTGTGDSSSTIYIYTKQLAPVANSYSDAVFFNTSYPLLSSLKLTGGLRWQNDRTQNRDDIYGTVYGKQTSACSSFLLSCFDLTKHIATINYGEHWHNITWKAGLDWQALTNVMLYTNVATGYSPGTSFDLGLNSAPDYVANTGSQVLIQYSIGEKARFFDNQLQVNGEAYITHYDKYNADVHLAGATSPYYATLTDSAYNDGGDVDVTWIVTTNDRLTLAAAYDMSNYGNVPLSAVQSSSTTVQQEVATALSGHTFQFSPKWTLSPGYQHVFDLNSGATLTLKANTQYQTAQFTDNSDSTLGVNKTHHMSNAYLTYNSFNGKWSLSGYVKNIENFAYITSFQAANANESTSQVSLSAPRTWGLVLNMKL